MSHGDRHEVHSRSDMRCSRQGLMSEGDRHQGPLRACSLYAALSHGENDGGDQVTMYW
jgi:hypothetical protein